MELLAQYPIEESACLPHVGRPVVAILPNGETVCGVMDRIHEGHLVLRPIEDLPVATVQSLRNSSGKHIEALPIKPDMKKKLRVLNKQMATTKAFGSGGFGGRPYGWGYGNYGWGAGWWWIFPLFWLAAIAAFAFAW